MGAELPFPIAGRWSCASLRYPYHDAIERTNLLGFALDNSKDAIREIPIVRSISDLCYATVLRLN